MCRDYPFETILNLTSILLFCNICDQTFCSSVPSMILALRFTPSYPNDNYIYQLLQYKENLRFSHTTNNRDSPGQH